MTFILRQGQDTFEVVDGPEKGRVFCRGRTYDQVPAAEKHRFEKVRPPKAKKTEKE